MKKAIIILVLLILAVAVIYKYWDTDSDLGDNYYFIPEYEATDVGSPYGAVVYKSEVKNSYSVEDIKISEKVIQAEARGNYIIAIQELKNDTVKKYFVIDKRSDKIFNNLNKKEFENLCSKLNIKQF